MNSLWLLLLPVAAAFGWFYRSVSETKAENSKTIATEGIYQGYAAGLNYLLNEQPDKAIDIFIKLFTVNSETIETHLALGALFRKKGEVDRAIRIHQNLIARPLLSPMQRGEALLALGLDYLRSGVLDAAEKTFYELAQLKSYTQIAHTQLLTIYECEKDWNSAIETAKVLRQLTGKSYDLVIGHYYCELTETALQEHRMADVPINLRQALFFAPDSLRSNLLEARWRLIQHDDERAIRIYQKMIVRHPDYHGVVLPEWYRYLREKGKESLFYERLHAVYDETTHDNFRLILALKLDKALPESTKEALYKKIEKRFSLKNLFDLLQYELKDLSVSLGAGLKDWQKILEKYVDNQMSYRCRQCGFMAKDLLWHCPGCHQWETLHPIDKEFI